MKAWVLYGIGDLRFADIPAPAEKAGEVIIKVKCAGICSSDILRVYKTGAYYYPIILGHELSGITQTGRRVSVFPLIPCFLCDSCKTSVYETCSQYSYIGSRRDGAFAEYVSVPEWNLTDIPDTMSFEEAALIEPAAVALHTVKKIDLTGVTNAAVIGAGVIGLFIARWLRLFGIGDITVLGRNDYPKRRFDICAEAAGSADALNKCIELTHPNGQLVLAGNPDTGFELEQKPYWNILRKQLTVYGSWNSRYPEDWRAVIENADRLCLSDMISHRYPFDKLNEAMRMMYERNERICKVMIKL